MQGGSVSLASTESAFSLPEYSEQAASMSEKMEIDLVAISLLLWRHRWWVLLVTIVVTAAAAYYAFTTPPTYRAEVVTTEVREQPMGGAAAIANQLSGLVNLTNLGLGGDRSERDAEAVLESRRLISEFITRNNLLPQLSPGSKKPRTLWRAVQQFQKNVLSIRQDPRRGITTLSVEWTDPATSARWANGLVALANELVRVHAMDEAQRNITYLNTQEEHTNDVDLRRVIFNLIENETKTLMMANGRPEYAFRTVDPAVPPEIRSAPHRTMLLATGLAVGLLLGGMLVLTWDWVRRQRVRLRGIAS